MKKWMILMRESDGTHFLWNGEGCIRVSCINDYSQFAEIPKWHHDYDHFPDIEKTILNEVMNSSKRGFKIMGHGRYQVIARGEFRDSQ